MGLRSLGVALASTAALIPLPAVAPPPALAADANLSQGRTATSSSTENAATPATAAVDGDTATRWSSAATDDQWLQVDLGATASISQVVLNWEAAYAADYKIQVSSDARTWSDLRTVNGGDGGTDTLAVSGQGRYVRMQGIHRATPWGYSLWEFQVFGIPGTTQPSSCSAAGSAGGLCA